MFEASGCRASAPRFGGGDGRDSRGLVRGRASVPASLPDAKLHASSDAPRGEKTRWRCRPLTTTTARARAAPAAASPTTRGSADNEAQVAARRASPRASARRAHRDSASKRTISPRRRRAPTGHNQKAPVPLETLDGRDCAKVASRLDTKVCEHQRQS